MSTDEMASPNLDMQALKIVSSSARWAAAAGAVPVPFLDMLAVGGVQSKMVVDLAALYGQSASGEAARAAVSVLLGTLLPAGLTNTLLGTGAKLFPGGVLFGMASMSALSAAATYAIGKVFIRHFEAGGSLTTFRTEAVGDQLRREFDEAKSQKTVEGTP